jgi:hypothetical protein
MKNILRCRCGSTLLCFQLFCPKRFSPLIKNRTCQPFLAAYKKKYAAAGKDVQA